jgi:PPP family 3-phenylpropionic acid transporter
MARPTQFSTDSFALKLGLFYAAYFFFGGVQLPFFPLWLESRGLDARTIGMVIAVPTLMRIVATPIITHTADRHRALRATLAIGSVVGLLGMTVVGLVDGPIAILVAFTVAMMALSPMLSLSDAYALSGLGARGRSYGPVRLWGSVAFIAGNVGAGFLLQAIAPGYLIWLIVFALAIVVAAASSLDPVDAGTGPAAAQPRPSPKILLRNPAFLTVVLASSMIQGSHALYYGFSTMDWRAGGLDGTVIGMLWGLGVAAEIVLFAFSGGCQSRSVPPRYWRSVALAPSCAGRRWRSIRRWRCCRRCKSCTPARSARRISA